jgi:Tol biopolymer transport system component
MMLLIEETSPMTSIPKRFAIIATTASLLTLMSLPAHATYPGANGEIVYGRDGQIRAMLADGSDDHQLSAFDGYFSSVSFSSDGTKAAVAEYTTRGDRIVLIDLAAETRSVVLSPAKTPTEVLSSVALAPHAHRVAFSDGSYPRHLYTVGIDGSHLTKIATGYGDVDWGSNGRLVASNGIFHGDGTRFIATMDPDGGDVTVIATFPAVKDSWGSVYELVPSWAPDASAVVFTAQRYRIHPDIWWVGVDGSHLHKLTDTDKTSESGPTFSPDGTEVVFSVLQPHATETDLWLMAPDGTNVTQLTSTTASGEYPIAWLPA